MAGGGGFSASNSSAASSGLDGGNLSIGARTFTFAPPTRSFDQPVNVAFIAASLAVVGGVLYAFSQSGGKRKRRK